jgi:hypothetical protein
VGRLIFPVVSASAVELSMGSAVSFCTTSVVVAGSVVSDCAVEVGSEGEDFFIPGVGE